ncbi:MAG: FAD-binding oxidoreductase [Planctomycetota bacterium]
MPLSMWSQETAPLPPDPEPLPAHADIVVIGGGIAGVSTALWLARQGASTLLLEAGRVADRASGRNDGQMLLGLGEHYNRIVGQLGRDRARLLWDYIQLNNAAMKQEIAALDIDCGLRADGGLRLAETEHEMRELREAAALLHEDGIAHRLIEHDAVRDALPAAQGFFGALHLPGEAIVQPVAMVRGFARAARQAGARIVEGMRVVAVSRGESGFTVTTADGRRVRAEIVVHCTSTLARELDDSGFLRAQVFPFRGQILASEELSEELARQFPHCAMSSHFCYEYFRMHGRRLVVGGMRWSVKGEQLGILDDDGHDERVSRNLLDWVARHFPGLRDKAFPTVWTGIMAGTNDALPLLGALPGRPGVFTLLGFNGYGLSFAFLAGRSLAEQILTGTASHPAAGLFAPRRLS